MDKLNCGSTSNVTFGKITDWPGNDNPNCEQFLELDDVEDAQN